MSVEFEKVVLEKLDELSKDMRETKGKVNTLSDKVEKLKEKVDSNTTLISSLTEKVDNNTSLINNLTQKVDQLEDKVNNNTALINNLSKDVLDTQDILKIQGNNLAHFEHDCMLKLNTLFDSFVANSDSHAVFSKFIAQLNAESFDYRQRISKLEDHFRSSKVLAAN